MRSPAKSTSSRATSSSVPPEFRPQANACTDAGSARAHSSAERPSGSRDRGPMRRMLSAIGKVRESMPDSDLELAAQNAALTRQLLQWIADAPRTYDEALDTWRSSCPRHTIWEDALLAGLIERPPGQRSLVLTARGLATLRQPR